MSYNGSAFYVAETTAQKSSRSTSQAKLRIQHECGRLTNLSVAAFQREKDLDQTSTSISKYGTLFLHRR